MTLLNLISIVVAAGLLVVLILLHCKLRKKVEDADGMGDVNDRGKRVRRPTETSSQRWAIPIRGKTIEVTFPVIHAWWIALHVQQNQGSIS